MGGKKLSLIIAGIIGIAVLILGWFFAFGKKESGVVSPLSNEINQQPAGSQAEAENLVKYEDEAGFTFEYPESLAVKDITPEDNLTYSELEIISGDHAGKIIVRVKDAVKCTTVKCFLSENSGGEARDISLAGMAGKQVRSDEPAILQTVVIEDGVEYLIESPLAEPDSVFWNKVHNDIVFSFALNETAATGANAQAETSSGGGESIIEEEEVIE